MMLRLCLIFALFFLNQSYLNANNSIDLFVKSQQLQPLSKSSPLLDIANKGKKLIAVGERGHILVKSDKNDWRQIESPTTSMLTKVFFLNDRLGWAVGHDATILHTADSGESWSIQMSSTEIDKPFFDVLFFNPLDGVAIGAYGLFYRTSDGGMNWQQAFHESLLFEDDIEYLADLKSTDNGLYLSERAFLLPHFNRLLLLSDNRLLLIGESGLLAISSNQGETFSKLAFSYDGSLFSAIETKSGIYLMGLRGHLFKSNHSLSKWKKINIPTDASINNAFNHSGATYFVGNGGFVLRMSDESKFEEIANLKGQNILALAAGNDDQFWSVGSMGVKEIANNK